MGRNRESIENSIRLSTKKLARPDYFSNFATNLLQQNPFLNIKCLYKRLDQGLIRKNYTITRGAS